MSREKTIDVVAPPSAWSYERVTQLLGGGWFLLLAILGSVKLGARAGVQWPSLFSSFCLAVFYLLLAAMVLTRPTPKAQAAGWTPRVAAFVGTYLPWTIPLFGRTDQALPNLASSLCVLAGMVIMLATLRHLGRSFSLVPQARAVVKSGPYRWIKHPLYLSEEIAIFGMALPNLTLVTAALLLLHIGVQVSRILFEEDLLRRTCPDYAEYEASRWRVIPYVW